MSIISPSSALVMITRKTLIAPPGWLSAIISHGLIHQSYFFKYLWNSGDATADTEGVAENKKTWVSTSQEFPPPLVSEWDLFPDFANKGSSLTDKMGPSGLASSWFMEPWFYYYEFQRDTNCFDFGCADLSRLANYGGLSYRKGKRVSDIFSENNAYMANGGWNRKHPYLYFGLERAVQSQTGLVAGPDWKRLTRYYQNARWIVWAVETYRLHSGFSAPSWWRDHALSWSIGVPEGMRLGSGYTNWKNGGKTLGNLPPSEFQKSAEGEPIKLAVPATNMESILRDAITLVPRPGAIATGTELTTPRLANWPITAGSMRPGIGYPRDFTYNVHEHSPAREKEDAKTLKMLDSISAAMATVLSAVGAGWMGALSTAFMKVMEYSAFDSGSSKGVLGAALSAIGAVGEQFGVTAGSIYDKIESNTLLASAIAVATKTYEEYGAAASVAYQNLKSSVELLRKEWGDPEFASALMGSIPGSDVEKNLNIPLVTGVKPVLNIPLVTGVKPVQKEPDIYVAKNVYLAPTSQMAEPREPKAEEPAPKAEFPTWGKVAIAAGVVAILAGTLFMSGKKGKKK